MADIRKTDPYWIIKPIWDSKGYMQGYEVFRSISSADVAPVRHGRWIDTDRYGFPVMECSECGAQTGTLNFPYCFNCGARMDGENNEID